MSVSANPFAPQAIAMTAVAVSDGGTVSADGTHEPLTRNDDGVAGADADRLTITFLRDHPQGRAGETKKMANRVARERVAAGDAEFVY
jgi:hypothetical protein